MLLFPIFSFTLVRYQNIILNREYYILNNVSPGGGVIHIIRKTIRVTWILLLASLLLIPTSAFASNGKNSYSYGYNQSSYSGGFSLSGVFSFLGLTSQQNSQNTYSYNDSKKNVYDYDFNKKDHDYNYSYTYGKDDRDKDRNKDRDRDDDDDRKKGRDRDDKDDYDYEEYHQSSNHWLWYLFLIWLKEHDHWKDKCGYGFGNDKGCIESYELWKKWYCR